MKGLRRTVTIREGFYDDRGKPAETSIIALFVNFVCFRLLFDYSFYVCY